MPIPDSLSAIIRASLNALSQDPNGELPLRSRREIWNAFGEREKDGKDNPAGAGWQRRSRLAILCVQHILPQWQAVYPNDDRPQRMLDMSEQLLQSAYDTEEARQEQQNFFTELGDIASEEISAACAGYASVQAVTVAAVDLEDSGNYDPAETDHDLDAYQWDTSYYASMAAAGGDIFVDESSVDLRRAFWDWYLTEAVPSAFESA